MLKLVRNSENKVPVKVVSSIDYNGFSAQIEVAGVTKEIANLKSGNAKFVFSSSDTNAMSESDIGHMTVYDATGKVHMKVLVRIVLVDTAPEALGFSDIRIAIVSMKFIGAGGGYDYDIVKRSDFKNVSMARSSINSNNDTINEIVGILKGE